MSTQSAILPGSAVFASARENRTTVTYIANNSNSSRYTATISTHGTINPYMRTLEMSLNV